MHVALLYQLTVGLADLLFDVLLLSALGVVDSQGLTLVIAGSMLLGEELNRLLDEGKVHPHPLAADVNMNRLFYHLLLKTFL